MKEMQDLYDSEHKRLGLDNLDAPPYLTLTKDEYDWYLGEISDLIYLETDKQNMLDRIKNGLQKLLFRGVEVKIKN